MIFKAQRKGFHDPDEWIEGVLIQEGERAFIHSPGSLVKPITNHYAYALCVEIEKETLTPINEEEL